MATNLTLGQYMHRDSVLHSLDPRTKLALIAVYLISLFNATNTPEVFALLTGLAAIGVYFSQISWRHYFGNIKALWLVIVVSFIITNWGEPTLYPGLFAVWRLVLAVVVTSIVTYCTEPLALTDGLTAVASPLERLRFPVHELALIITIAMRFIPLLVEEAHKLYEAQKLRGANFNSLKPFVRARAYIALVVPLFLGSIRRADELAVAMESRFYQGVAGRTQIRELKLALLDKVLLSMAVLVLGIWIII